MFKTPTPVNEPILSYAPGTPQRASLKAMLEKLKYQKPLDVPMVINGRAVRTGKMGEIRTPHDHSLLLCKYHKGGQKEMQRAIEVALAAQKDWASWSWEERAAVFLKAADLLAGPYRDVMNAATMLGQSKTVFQAEIDAACEMIDFFRFNVHFARQIMTEQPNSQPGMWNRMEFRPLEGFIFAVTPFNFSSIAGNLPTAPAIMGNVVIWKPASTQVFAAHFFMQLLKEAGLPNGVINMVLGSGREIGQYALEHPSLAGVHFTGSTGTFQGMWKTIGGQIDKYKSYPRIVGETGGKDFIVVHPSAKVEEVATAIVRGAFEYQGQKCSAASRVYVPKTYWPRLQKEIEKLVATIKMGDVSEFDTFMGAVIDKKSFTKLKGYIERAKASKDAKVVIGGGCDDSVGWFIEPTVIVAKKPDYETMVDELFGPVVTVYLYPDNQYAKTLDLCDQTSPYALTGAVFAQDREAVNLAVDKLRQAAGNFYINDKPTGAVVNQQPFGGARASGTNDKAGSLLNMIRWTSPRSIKETFVPPTTIGYPHMNKE
jgi:1-pyrroline-5-carboxylate dehydrogenase